MQTPAARRPRDHHQLRDLPASAGSREAPHEASLRRSPSYGRTLSSGLCRLLLPLGLGAEQALRRTRFVDCRTPSGSRRGWGTFMKCFRPALQSSRAQWHRAVRLAVAAFVLALLRGIWTSGTVRDRDADGILRLLSKALSREEPEDMIHNEDMMTCIEDIIDLPLSAHRSDG
ncbi:unnamed protein product [Ectocarpus sp. 12 AP-2014]